MLRVGLTGGLGSGKSTAARLFAEHGAYVLSADELAREMMQPGEPVYNDIVQHFGPSVVLPDGQLDRSALARIAFNKGRVEELNAIVHPAVIERQAALADELFRKDFAAVAIVESALIFETKHGETKDTETETGSTPSQQPGAPPPKPWRSRFDCIILVTASDEVKIARYVERATNGSSLTSERRAELATEARLRLAQQIPDEEKMQLSDFVLDNNGSIEELEEQIDELWPILQFASRNSDLS
ncbi:dephospho-CoA kinase [Edaphobacter aggregans]|uniref:dephospho-CoA kinase n=1 Tax=Edaphobacter aggregans TaxID=570835 RepID=UPI000558336F|nr:dephospho-CoA kinase [Edaphobacter aggregans]